MSEEKSDLKGLVISFVIIVPVKATIASFYSEAQAKRNPMVGIPYGMTFLLPT